MKNRCIKFDNLNSQMAVVEEFCEKVIKNWSHQFFS